MLADRLLLELFSISNFCFYCTFKLQNHFQFISVKLEILTLWGKIPKHWFFRKSEQKSKKNDAKICVKIYYFGFLTQRQQIGFYPERVDPSAILESIECHDLFPRQDEIVHQKHENNKNFHHFLFPFHDVFNS
jgi:hypothetical protein